MNVFEELIEELKEENLIEETVIETSAVQESINNSENNRADLSQAKNNVSEDYSGLNSNASEVEDFSSELNDLSIDDTSLISEIYDDEAEKAVSSSAAQAVQSVNELKVENHVQPKPEKAEKSVQQPIDESEFYRKRAIDEVSCLQMVEHVFSGVEREQMKITPKPYDDLPVQIALHDFLQVSKNVQSAEHAQAEFQLMQETESWYSALSQRDKYISVASLRRYCETTRPVLSPQALMALARFYRNSPFTEQVRSKFDLVVTRLFSKEIGGERRQLTNERDELIENLTALYAEWASIPLYSVNEDENSDVLIAALKFEDFMMEADALSNLNEALKNDFFNLLRTFKESTNENFFAPIVTAAAIESNVRIGNRYIELVSQAKANAGSEKLEEEYGFLHDQVISEALGKTLILTGLLNQQLNAAGGEQTFSQAVETKISEINEENKSRQEHHKKTRSRVTKASQEKQGFLSLKFNKGLLAATVIIIVASLGLYFGVEYYSGTIEKSNENVKKVNLDNSSLKDYVKEARISKDTFFAITLSSWDNLDVQKKEEILKKIHGIGAEKGFSKVHLLASDGRLVGYASAENIYTY